MQLLLKLMIKHGAFLLKKLRFTASIAFTFLLLFVIGGCKSLPDTTKRQVKAIELLDNSSSFYVAIPREADSELIDRIIKGNVQNISNSDAQLISNHIEKVYCGLNRHKNTTEIQCAIDTAQIPVKMVPKILTAKKGWVHLPYKVEGSENKYLAFDYNGLQMLFPSQNLFCLGRGLDFMIHKYDTIASLPIEDTSPYYEIPEELYNYLEAAQNDIRFYANKPQSFLTILTGTQLNLNLTDVRGSFVIDQLHPSQYILKLHFRFKSEKMLKAGKTLLILAFGLTDSQASVAEGEAGSNELIIQGIKLDKQQLYKLLVL